MTEGAKIITRQAVISDRNFILSTWLKGIYFGNPYFRLIPQDLYYLGYADQIQGILLAPGVQVKIACDEKNPSWIVGFAVYRGESLYFIYVKKDYRQRGIASLLIQGEPITTIKHTTKLGQSIADKKGWIFNPFP